MANWNVCYNWMMDNEDRTRACKTVPDPVTPHLTPDMTEEEKQAEIQKAENAQAISGINSYYFPVQFAKIAALPQSQRAPAVQQFYKDELWNQWFDGLNSDEVGKRVLDATVNMGGITAVKILQRAINSAAHTYDDPVVTVDGKWGPATVREANNIPVPDYLVIEFKRLRLGWYQDIVTKNPNKAKFLGTQDNPGPWWRRATA